MQLADGVETPNHQIKLLRFEAINEASTSPFVITKKASGDDSNLVVHGSPINKIGDPTPPISERQQPLVFIDFATLEKPDFSLEFVEKYRNGFSVAEIEKLYRTSKRKVTASIKRNGGNMRPAHTLSTVEALRSKSTGGCKPYYGFCDFEGRLVKHPTEFPILLTIHRHWQRGLSAHYINLEFAKTKAKSRQGRKWCWGSIQNILKRFEDKKVILHKGGRYELG